jgi:hypothetical protein
VSAQRLTDTVVGPDVTLDDLDALREVRRVLIGVLGEPKTFAQAVRVQRILGEIVPALQSLRLKSYALGWRARRREQ